MISDHFDEPFTSADRQLRLEDFVQAKIESFLPRVPVFYPAR